MAAETCLVTDLEKLSVRADGPAIGGIWLEIGGAAFPEVGWSDFIVVVLAWLSAAILDVLRYQASARRVHFMDGPYAVDVSMAPSGQLQFRMFAGAGGRREGATGEVDVETFATDVAVRSRELLAECRRQGWWSPDAHALATHLSELDRELTSWRTGGRRVSPRHAPPPK